MSTRTSFACMLLLLALALGCGDDGGGSVGVGGELDGGDKQDKDSAVDENIGNFDAGKPILTPGCDTDPSKCPNAKDGGPSFGDAGDDDGGFDAG